MVAILNLWWVAFLAAVAWLGWRIYTGIENGKMRAETRLERNKAIAKMAIPPIAMAIIGLVMATIQPSYMPKGTVGRIALPSSQSVDYGEIVDRQPKPEHRTDEHFNAKFDAVQQAKEGLKK